MTGVLEGIRVLDFGRFIAGPWCGALLADMGAEVIRIEKVDGGEDRRAPDVRAAHGGGVQGRPGRAAAVHGYGGGAEGGAERG